MVVLGPSLVPLAPLATSITLMCLVALTVRLHSTLAIGLQLLLENLKFLLHHEIVQR